MSVFFEGNPGSVRASVTWCDIKTLGTIVAHPIQMAQVFFARKRKCSLVGDSLKPNGAPARTIPNKVPTNVALWLHRKIHRSNFSLCHQQ